MTAVLLPAVGTEGRANATGTGSRSARGTAWRGRWSTRSGRRPATTVRRAAPAATTSPAGRRRTGVRTALWPFVLARDVVDALAVEHLLHGGVGAAQRQRRDD